MAKLIFIILGLFYTVLWYDVTSKFWGLEIGLAHRIIHVAPAAVCYAAAWLSYKYRGCVIPLTASFLLFIAHFYFTFVIVSGGYIAKASQEPADYERMLITYWNPNAPHLVEHFPRNIPAEASDIVFRHSPVIWQNTGSIELKYSASSNHLAQAEDIFAANARYTTTNHYHIFSDINTTQSKQYKIITIYDSQSDEERLGEPNPNHGALCGVAICLKYKDIIYWAATW